MYINPRIVAFTIQLVLLPSFSCALCELFSSPWIKDASLETLQCDSQTHKLCVTCLHTRKVIFLGKPVWTFFTDFSSCSTEAQSLHCAVLLRFLPLVWYNCKISICWASVAFLIFVNTGTFTCFVFTSLCIVDFCGSTNDCPSENNSRIVWT